MRIYSVSFENVTLPATNPCDAFLFLPADDRPIKLMAFALWVPGATTVGQVRVTVNRYTGAFSNGSGGATPTPALLSSSLNAAAGFTAHTMDTTAASGGTKTVLLPYALNNLNGLYELYDPESRPGFVQGEGCVIRVEAGFAAGAGLSGSARIMEPI